MIFIFGWLNKREKVEQFIYPNVEKVFKGFIGNEEIVNYLKRIIKYSQFQNTRKLPNIALYGPKSSGKTELTRRIAKAIKLELITINKSVLENNNDFIKFLEERSFEFKGIKRVLPYILFIDEAHTLSRRLQDLLLTGLEPNDRTIKIKENNYNCQDVNFIIATTDPGKLTEAFRSRFTELYLQSYTPEEIIKILKIRMVSDKEIDSIVQKLDYSSLEFIARASRCIPRKAIALLKDISKGIALGELQPNFESIFNDLSKILKCDYLGLTSIDRKYLCLLYKNKMLGQNSLISMLNIDKDTLLNFIEPYLIQLKLIIRTPKGRKLTEAGEQLAKIYNDNIALYEQ